MEEFRYRERELWCEEVDLAAVVRAHGTPTYVYSSSSILDHCRWIERAFGPTDHLSCYAVKANANRAVLRLLAGEGIGADVGSLGELTRALEAGFTPARLTFSGVGKRDDELEFALRKAILSFNVESEEELEVISSIAVRLNLTARVCLRVNFDIPSETHPYITTGRKENKFGIDRATARAIARRRQTFPNVELMGIHTHIGSQITKAETFVEAGRAVVDFVTELRSEGIPLKQINFGGGFGVRYRNYLSNELIPEEPDDADAELTTVGMLAAVLPVLRGAGCTILIQPGRSIVAHAGILLTNVLYRKNTKEKTFIIVDAGMNDLIRPSLYQSYHQIVPLELKERGNETVDVVGPLCESGDFFAHDRLLPRCERGETLAVLCAGAYGFVLSSNYNGRPRPAEVLVEGKKFTLVTPRELTA
jgi:diaminopimelate decarboxylase